MLFLVPFFILILSPPIPILAAHGPDPSVNQYFNQNEERPTSPKEETNKQSEDGTVSLWGLAGQTFLALLLILLLLYGLAWWIKKGKRGNENEHMGVLATFWVSQNKSIQLIRIGSHFFLIGVGENITLLYHFEKEEEITTILQSLNAPKESLRNGWMDRMLRLLPSHRKREGERDSFKEELIRQMEQLRSDEGRNASNRGEEDQDER